MAITDDYAKARNLLTDRANRLSEKIVGGGRYSYENAAQADTQDGRWLAADLERMRQLNMLEKASSDPEFGRAVQERASTWQTDQNARAGEADRRGRATGRAALAARGLAGSGDEEQMVARADARMAAAKARAEQGARELRDAGMGSLEDLQRQLLAEIMAEDAGGAYSAGLDSLESQGNLDRMAAGGDADYRNLLANTLAGFIQTGVEPLVEGGYDRQSLLNDRLLEQYHDGLDTWRQGGGERPPYPSLVDGWMDAWRR